jgi:hypothetical protein
MGQTEVQVLDNQKGEVLQMRDAVHYLVRFKFLPDALPAKPEIDKIIKDSGWEPNHGFFI